MKVQEAAQERFVTGWESDTLREAARRLIEEEVGALVIFGSTGVRGIFSERDLARAIADEADLDEIEVDEYMTESPVSISKDSSLRRAVEKMDTYAIRHLLVLDEGDPVGVISVRDIVHAMEERHRYP